MIDPVIKLIKLKNVKVDYYTHGESDAMPCETPGLDVVNQMTRGDT